MMSHEPDRTHTCGESRHRAAIYVRMSSNPQDHSIQHQIDALNRYAHENHMEIVMVYADAGKSGLQLNGREGLQALITDVQSGTAAFDLVLVYDISRWGRFQDIDESAYYEFICRQAGVDVIYCAEHFANDGSPMYALMKGVKRIMAAEYSRELGEKVHLAQCRFSQMGFKQGGRPGYGLRRLPVSPDGETRAPLAAGERKPQLTDRVALFHGAPEELQTIRRIYRLYTEEGWTDSDIAAKLRSEGLCNHMGKPWDNCTVRRILTNPRYCGEIIYNQTTRRLKSRVTNNPECQWIRCANALAPIVDRGTFDRAQAIRWRRRHGPERDQVLEKIRAIFNEHGTISESICRKSALPGRDYILRLFGSYVGAYAAAGLPPQFTSTGALGNRSMHVMTDALIAEVSTLALHAGATVRRTHVWNVLRLNENLDVKVSIASRRYCDDGMRRWRVPLTCGARADFVLCGLMDDANRAVESYLLLAPLAVKKASLLLSRRRLALYTDAHFAALEQVFGLDRQPQAEFSEADNGQ
jgi:DNA invertase Pin-like site-specific DNA recombinase